MDADSNAVTSAREWDALKDEDVTPLPASKPHVVFVRSTWQSEVKVSILLLIKHDVKLFSFVAETPTR